MRGDGGAAAITATKATTDTTATANGIYENGARVKACIGFFGCNQARGKHLLALEAHEKEWAVGS